MPAPLAGRAGPTVDLPRPDDERLLHWSPSASRARSVLECLVFRPESGYIRHVSNLGMSFVPGFPLGLRGVRAR
jgi:hypothetical protein